MSEQLGRYEVLSPIGAGGMASVHLGRALGAGGFERLVAIKMMHPELANDPSFVAMFLDEGRLAAQIRHPNVVGTLDIQEGPRGLILVMEYVEGPSLGAILRACAHAGKLVPLPIALRIVIDVLLGLHAAHEQVGSRGEPLHIVHRDVSPQNILVSVAGVAKITDFGVAYAEARMATTKGSTMKGNIGYMPPQQVHGEKPTRRTDVYSAAVVLWELLAGERLFRGENEGARLFAVLAGAQRSPREVAASVPPSIDCLCMRALAIDPGARPATALAFAEALEAAATQEGVTIASARELAAFVQALGAHKPPRLERRSSGKINARQSASIIITIEEPSTGPALPAPRRTPEGSQVGPAESAVTIPVLPKKRRSRAMILGALASGASLIVTAASLRSSAPDATSSTPPASRGYAPELGATSAASEPPPGGVVPSNAPVAPGDAASTAVQPIRAQVISAPEIESSAPIAQTSAATDSGAAPVPQKRSSSASKLPRAPAKATATRARGDAAGGHPPVGDSAQSKLHPAKEWRPGSL